MMIAEEAAAVQNGGDARLVAGDGGSLAVMPERRGFMRRVIGEHVPVDGQVLSRQHGGAAAVGQSWTIVGKPRRQP